MGTRSYFAIGMKYFIIEEVKVQHLVIPKEMSKCWEIRPRREKGK